MVHQEDHQVAFLVAILVEDPDLEERCQEEEHLAEVLFLEEFLVAFRVEVLGQGASLGEVPVLEEHREERLVEVLGVVLYQVEHLVADPPVEFLFLAEVRVLEDILAEHPAEDPREEVLSAEPPSAARRVEARGAVVGSWRRGIHATQTMSVASVCCSSSATASASDGAVLL